ncbi:MAG: cell envelope integrity protein TolA [Burkholderiales bacterium]
MSATVVANRSDRPRRPHRTRGKGWAFVLALAVQLGFLAVLVFSIQWQNRRPDPISAELYAPPAPKAPVVEQPPPPPPQPQPEPKPAPPPPAPVPAPVPQPAPPPKPVPAVPQPDPRAAEIALKAKQEQERKQKEEADRRQRELEEKRKLEERKQAEAKERQQKEMAAMRAQAERETQLRAQAEREQQLRAQAAKELAQREAQQAAEASARSKAEADWIRRIQAKVKGNVIVPSDIAGNPEAIFEVVQLPTGEIIEATLRKSSGNRAYDDAVQRAIIKSSPLPRPDRSELFQRALTLKFRPQD